MGKKAKIDVIKQMAAEGPREITKAHCDLFNQYGANLQPGHLDPGMAVIRLDFETKEDFARYLAKVDALPALSDTIIITRCTIARE